jgi:hypothetical protein
MGSGFTRGGNTRGAGSFGGGDGRWTIAIVLRASTYVLNKLLSIEYWHVSSWLNGSCSSLGGIGSDQIWSNIFWRVV